MSDFITNDKFKENVEREMSEKPFAILSRVICKQLYQEIISGNLLPEHRIIESKIAQSLNVSRTPVKMALGDMIDDGILVKGTGKTLHVKSVTYEDCLWIYEARMALEPQAASLAARRINTAELKELRELVEVFEEVDHTLDENIYVKADKRFHEVIISASKNPYFTNMYKSIECPLACYRNQLNQLAYEMHFQTNNLEKGSFFHKAIYNMLKNHLPLMAESEMRNDISRMYGTLSQLQKITD